MPDTARSRTGLQASLGTDDIRTIDDTMIAAFDIIETLVPLDSQGTSAPAGTGKRGEWYYRTSTGELFRSTGSAWVNVGTMISDGGVAAAKLATDAVETAKIKDANVTKAKLATDALNAFPKLKTAADVKMAFGSTTVTFSGTQAKTGDTIAHGLGTTPSAVFLTAKGPNGLQPMIASPYTIDGTNITFATSALAATYTGTVTVYWQAFA